MIQSGSVYRPYSKIAAGLTLVVLGVLLYAPSLRFSSFHYDDVNVIVENRAVHTLQRPSRFFTDAETGMATAQRREKGDVVYRPLLAFSFALDHALWGTDARGYRATNLIIHLVMVLAALGLVLRLGFEPLTAWLTAAAILIHPVHVQVVDYVSARSSGLSGAMMLGATWAYVRSHQGGSRWSYPLALGLGCSAVLTKESAAALPVLLLLTELVEPNRGWRDVRWRSLAPFVLIVVVFVWIRSIALNPFSEPVPRPDRSPPLVLAWTVLRLLVSYAHLWVFPLPLGLDHPFGATGPGADWKTVVVGASLLGGIASVLWGIVSGIRVLAFGPLWFAMALAPSCVLPWITTRALLFEHRAYIANFGLALLTASILVWLIRGLRGVPRVVVITVASTVTIGWISGTLIYAETWKTPLTAWEHAVRVAPDSLPAHYNLGIELRAIGRNSEALAEFERARALNPLLKDIERQIEAIRGSRGEWLEVIVRNETLVREDPSREFAWFNLGVAYQKIGSRERALDAYERAIALRPSRAASYVNRGTVLIETQQIAEAISAFQQAIAIEPSLISARYNLAVAFQMAGRVQAARQEYRALLNLLPASESGERFRASVEIALRELDENRR